MIFPANDRSIQEHPIDYDFILVGAGAAGCVLADRLSADPRHRVLLLEAGLPDDKPEIRIPAAFSKLFKTEYDWNYSAVPQAGLQGRESYWAKGRTLGGSTSINAMMYLRGVPSDYDGWEAMGNHGWGWQDVLPYFRRSERNSRGGDAFHGDSGSLYVEDLRDRNPQFAPVMFYNYGLTPPTQHGMTIGPTLIAPQSIGSMQLRSPNPLDYPIIDPQYLSDPEGHDLRVMMIGVRKAQEIFASSPMATYRSNPILPDRPIEGDRDLEEYIRSTSDGWWHPVGMCRMGTDPLAVVDPTLRVHGIEGLRVADASVMPTVPRCHTMAPTIMIGEKAADLILGQVFHPAENYPNSQEISTP